MRDFATPYFLNLHTFVGNKVPHKKMQYLPIYREAKVAKLDLYSGTVKDVQINQRSNVKIFLLVVLGTKFSTSTVLVLLLGQLYLFTTGCLQTQDTAKQ